MNRDNTRILTTAKRWLTTPFDPETQKQVQDLIRQGGNDLIEAFHKDLDFGTGGLRGIVGPGTNRINRYTVGRVTLGLARYIQRSFPEEEHSVAIAFDCRTHSASLAGSVADILSTQGIKVYLFESLRPTPELSFTLRYLHCQAGVVITASHNPKTYNGYKVYWQDGAQIAPPHDRRILQEIAAISFEQIPPSSAAQRDCIYPLGNPMDQAYIEACTQSVGATTTAKKLKIAYTPLHGTSIMVMPELLAQAGFGEVHIVEQQAQPDGNFPTVASPNPEEPEAMRMVLDLAKEKETDLALGTDPDSDRVGFAVRDDRGEMRLLDGNQSAALMMDYVLSNYTSTPTQPIPIPFVASTVVSSDLLLKISRYYKVQHERVLTGFKWIGALIHRYEGQKQFLCGGEESYGFLVGDAVRDKDAQITALLFCQMAEQLRSEQGLTVWQKLQELYLKHGLYKDQLLSITLLKGQEGTQKVSQLMRKYREGQDTEIAGSKIIRIQDFQNSQDQNFSKRLYQAITLPETNLLIFFLDDGSKVAIRPSGTEPKIKAYLSARAEIRHIDEIKSVEEKLTKTLEGKSEFFKHLFG